MPRTASIAGWPLTATIDGAVAFALRELRYLVTMPDAWANWRGSLCDVRIIAAEGVASCPARLGNDTLHIGERITIYDDDYVLLPDLTLYRGEDCRDMGPSTRILAVLLAQWQELARDRATLATGTYFLDMLRQLEPQHVSRHYADYLQTSAERLLNLPREIVRPEQVRHPSPVTVEERKKTNGNRRFMALLAGKATLDAEIQ